MSRGATTALGRPDRLWPAVAASVAAHALLLGFGLAGRRPATLEAGQQPLVARLVRQGEVRDQKLLPRKETPPPPAAESPAPAPAPAPAAPPSPTAVPVVSATPAAKPAAKATARPGPAEKPGKPSGPRLSTLLSEFKKDLATEGRPDGSPDGDAATPGEGDEYLAQVRQLLRQNYRLPTTISERERQFLTGTVVLYIEADGRISRSEVTKRSGNAAFDEALERAVREVRLPPPPPERRQLYRNGVNFEFKI